MKRKILSIAMATVLALTIVACGDGNVTESSTSDGSSTTTEVEVTDEGTSTTTAEETEETTTEATTVEETTEETTVEETEETTVEEPEETDTSTNGDWELTEDGNIALPEFDAIERNTIRNEYAPGAESEEAALVTVDDFTIEDFEGGAVVRNTSDYTLTYAYFDIEMEGAESTPLALYQSTIAPGDYLPTLITAPEDAGTDGVVNPVITGMYVVISTDFGYQEIMHNFNEQEGTMVVEYEEHSMQNLDQVWITEDELDITITGEGDSITATVVNNSEWPIAEFSLSLDAPDIVMPSRYSDFIFNFSRAEDESLALPLLPGETISRTIDVRDLLVSIGEDVGYISGLFIDVEPYLEEFDVSTWSVTRHNINIGPVAEGIMFSNLTQHEYQLDSYYQSQFAYDTPQ